MELPSGIQSVPHVCDVEVIAHPEAVRGQPDLLCEIPHGATATRHYSAIRGMLSPDLPDDLIDYFFVNTDVGSTEYARRVAELVVEGSERPLSVVLLRCLIPRTFIDTNRVIDADSTEANGARLTTAMADYIRDPQDAETLLDMYRRYHAVAERGYELVCGSGGLAVMAHTYAPRSVEIESFDEGIGRALRRAYEPEQYANWKVRPPVDLITKDPEGVTLAPKQIVETLLHGYAEIDIEATENACYRLHPISMAHRYSARYPDQVLCVEIARDLLADPFSPFEEMNIAHEKVNRISGPIATALLTGFSSGRARA